MNKSMLIPPVLVLALAACAAEPYKVADCKVTPIEIGSTASYGGQRTRPVDQLDRDYALLQLQSTPFYRRELAGRGYGNNTLVDAVRDCY